MKIAFFGLGQKQKEHIKKSPLKNHELIFFKDPLSKKDIQKIKDVDVLSIFLYSKITKDIIDELPNLTYIFTRSTGFDHIDLEACKKRNILVSYAPRYATDSVAEHTFALILALARNIYPSVQATKQELLFQPDKEFRGFELKGKTLGIIGCGRIGRQVVRLANAFGMKVLIYEKSPDLKFCKQTGVEAIDLDTLLAKSDIITLHVPYLKETHHLIDKKAIEKMKDGVVIINTARGAVIDTKALLEGLKSGKILAAGLDVLEGEKEFIQKKGGKFRQLNYELMAMPNVIVTPHNAFNSSESISRLIDHTIEGILAFIAGKPQDLVPA